ncbi:MAG: DNA polymerase IV [Hyphomicrobiales bacterium]
MTNDTENRGGNGNLTAFCRDCFEPAPQGQGWCASCKGRRIVRHDELAQLSIAHMDCDAFYAAVEKRDNPDLRDKPVIIGGGKRGVVSTACYVARINGVGSAMPMFKALKACPDAVVIRPNMEKYSQVGREVRALMRDLTPQVEPISIDEAFMDLTGTERLHGAIPALTLAKLAKRIEEEIEITVSIGLSHNKFLAKVASDLEKPRGFSVIGQAETLSFLADQPVSIIWGVGKALKASLNRDGIRTVSDLQRLDKAHLMKRYGNMGSRLYHLSRGEDTRTINPRGEAKSISAETTFNNDIADLDELSRHLWRLSEKVSRRAKASGVAGETVVLKLKTARFRIRTRNRKLSEPTQLADVIYRTARPLLEREATGTLFRLIGVGISQLCPEERADPPDLLDPAASQRATAERAMDELRKKFGSKAIEKGRGLKSR